MVENTFDHSDMQRAISERSATAALRDSEERMRLATEATGVGIWELNLKTCDVHWDAQMFRLYGVQPTADGMVPYAVWSAAVLPGELLAQEQSMRETVRTKGRGRREFGIHRANDGEHRILQAVETVRLNARDEVEYVVGTNLDVTERKAEEAALHASEARFRTAVALNSSLIWTNNSKGMMEGEQPGWGAFTGQSRAEYQDYGWSKAVHPDDAQPTLDAWNAAVAGKRLFEFEHRVRRHDGQWRTCSVRAMPLLDDHGAIREWLGIHTDITELKQAAETLRKSEERAQSIIKSISDGFITMDTEWRIIYLSPRGADILAPLQLTSSSVLGKNFWDAIPGVAGTETETRYRRAMESQRTEAFELFYAPLNRWFDIRAYPSLQGMALYFLDTTDRKIAEETLRANERVLAEQAAALRSADRSKDEFLATLAHELRNPLAAIRNGLGVMRACADDPVVIGQSRNMIERQSAQLVRMVDDLMDVSRITRGKIELRRSRVELGSIVNSAVETSRTAIDAAGHELTIVMPPGPVFVDADATRLGQVLANLLHNSAKYSEPRGRIQLTCQCQQNDVILSVKDTGIGIAPEMRDKVFDLFTQINGSIEKPYGGLGIGLTLVKRLVELHGGTISVNSDGLGKGSEFVISLPGLVSAQEDCAEALDSKPSDQPAATYRILAADDNADSLEALKMLLEMANYTVLTANDGREALALAEEFRPDVILLDIGMPQLNGYDTCRMIRQKSWAKNTLLIALTGWGQREDRQRTKDAGFDYHLVKPVDVDDLIKLIVQALAASKSR